MPLLTLLSNLDMGAGTPNVAYSQVRRFTPTNRRRRRHMWIIFALLGL